MKRIAWNQVRRLMRCGSFSDLDNFIFILFDMGIRHMSNETSKEYCICVKKSVYVFFFRKRYMHITIFCTWNLLNSYLEITTGGGNNSPVIQRISFFTFLNPEYLFYIFCTPRFCFITHSVTLSFIYHSLV